jgi:hypothetical protein
VDEGGEVTDDDAMALLARVHWLEAEVRRLSDELDARTIRRQDPDATRQEPPNDLRERQDAFR